MQSDSKEIYRLTAQRTKLSEQMYKEVGNSVLNNLYKKLRRPESLILKLRGVGTWYLRKKRMEILIEVFPPDFEMNEEDFYSPLDILKYENRKEIFLIFKERLKEYEEYMTIKKEIRRIRNESQTLLEPDDRED